MIRLTKTADRAGGGGVMVHISLALPPVLVLVLVRLCKIAALLKPWAFVRDTSDDIVRNDQWKAF
jgi:hypothetical protein